MGKSSKDKRDIYYRLAKEQQWRARSAFKLLQLDEAFDLFSGVSRVVDLCAAPGSWSQVLSRVLIQRERIGRAAWEDKRYAALLEHHPSSSTSSSPPTLPPLSSPHTSPLPPPPTLTPSAVPPLPTIPPPSAIKIVAIDLQPMSPLEGIVTLKADITHPSTVPLLLRALDPDYDATPASSGADPEAAHPVDLVLSDGAPDVTGLHDLDIYVQSQLLWAALNLAMAVLKEGGKFVAKIFRAKDVDVLYAQLKMVFERVTVAKPRSSRASSVEAFIVCTGFRRVKGLGLSVGLERPLEEKEGTSLEGGGGGDREREKGRRRVREDGEVEMVFDDEDDEEKEEGRGGEDGGGDGLERRRRWIAPFLACGDLSSFDADASHVLPEGHVSLDPVQPPTAPPYRTALEERKKLGGAYGKTKLGAVG